MNLLSTDRTEVNSSVELVKALQEYQMGSARLFSGTDCLTPSRKKILHQNEKTTVISISIEQNNDRPLVVKRHIV